MLKKMLKKMRALATTKIAGFIIYWFARGYSATFRLRVENEQQWLQHVEQGGRVLICAWHQQFFIGARLFAMYRKYKTSIMSSRSLDGDIASRIAEAAHVYPVRGSSSRGGQAALREMMVRLKKYPLAVHMLDGPRGPAGIVKPGAIAIAQGAQAAIVPGYVTADRAWLMRSWDRFLVPKPFARVTVTFLPLIKLHPAKDEIEFEEQRIMLEKSLQNYLHH
jgi:lysophospholipid acyltransferase (LPLAT)-like uncharacterized protein